MRLPKIIPLATDWSTIQHFRIGAKERASTIGFSASYGPPRPPSLLCVISAIGNVTVEGVPVTYGAIALGAGWYKQSKALEILALETDRKHDEQVREWLINQAMEACRALGYQCLFRSKRGLPELISGDESPLSIQNSETKALPERAIDV